jgi:hypothetical protein
MYVVEVTIRRLLRKVIFLELNISEFVRSELCS